MEAPSYSQSIKPLGLTLLITMAVINAVWAFLPSWAGASIATALYTIVALRWYMKDYLAGGIAGVLGFGIHLYVLLFHPLEDLQVFETVFFYLNLLIPIPIACFGFLLYPERK
ncbi:MAG TPA: hypothetical protein G4O08_11200 [Anaerolineae bacterium]|nr:hypothetical protein [Anaerolineae bacterium]